MPQNTLPTLWQHQRDALAKCGDRKDFAFFMEMGTGKTGTIITRLRDVYKKHGSILPTLILAPVIVCENWRREIGNFSHIDIDKHILVLRGNIVSRAKDILTTNKEIIITNHEALTSPKFVSAVQLRKFRVLVVDECHRFKSHDAKRSKTLHDIADRIEYRYIASGSPIVNSELDIWGQLRIIQKVPENFFTFRARYFWDKNARMPKKSYFPAWEIKPESRKELATLIEENSFSVKKEEALKNLPPLIRKPYYIEMSEEQELHYRNVEQDFLTTYEDEGRCVTTTVISQLLRLQQIASGILPLTDIGKQQILSNGKDDALEELLKEITPRAKVIVWSHWKPTYEIIADVCERLNIRFVTLTGETKQSEREENIRAFNEDPRIKVLIGNQGAGGIGVNLTAASYAIYFSKSYSLEADMQSEARNYRGGSEIHKSITRIDLISRGTVEEEIEEALWKKTQIGDALLRYRERLDLHRKKFRDRNYHALSA